MRARGPSTEQLQCAWQNRQRADTAVSIGAAVRAFVATEGLQQPSPLTYLRGIWEQLVGPELSRHSSLEGLRRGTLRVTVDSAAHLTELQALVRAGLAADLSDQLEDQSIRTVRLQLGGQRRRCSRPSHGNKRH